MKVGALPIISIGLAVGLIGAGFGYFHRYEPNMKVYESYKATADKYEEEAKKLPRAYEKRFAAEKYVQERADAWQKVVAVRTPSSSLGTGGIDLGVNSYQLVVDSRVFANNVQKAVNTQVKKGGVVVNWGGNEIPLPGDSASTIVADYYNYPAIPFPVVIYDLGQIRVTGTWAQIKANVEAWSSMPNYLAVADGLQVEGTGNVLSASYNVTIVGFLPGKNLYPNVPEVAGTAGPGGGQPQGLPTGGGQRPGGFVPPGSGGNAPQNLMMGPQRGSTK